MRNEVKIFPQIKSTVPYSSLIPGQMFRYVEPWNDDNVYMVTNNPDYCFHLNSGVLYTVGRDRSVVPLTSEQSVNIKSTNPCAGGMKGQMPY